MRVTNQRIDYGTDGVVTLNSFIDAVTPFEVGLTLYEAESLFTCLAPESVRYLGPDEWEIKVPVKVRIER